jgi:DNA polymerase I-like protein with 3'-5' exonuclease and polymerase domains
MEVQGNMSVNGTTYMNGLLTLKNELTSYSDRRIKKNILPLEHCLEKITTIHGYTFQRKDRVDEKQFIGMIAQEIEEPFPELVSEIEENGHTIKTVNYPAFTSVLLECIQELKERIILLENKIFR